MQENPDYKQLDLMLQDIQFQDFKVLFMCGSGLMVFMPGFYTQGFVFNGEDLGHKSYIFGEETLRFEG